MRNMILALSSVLVTAHLLFPAASAEAQACTDDYVSVDTITATILEIVPAPDPFVSADMLLKGPERCTPIWMQVLKSDAAQCRIGDRVQARGIIVSDPDSNAWNINPLGKLYMLLDQDYSCTR
jgi:hypothetical protein